MIQKNHSDEFKVEIRFQEAVTKEDFDKYDIVHFHRFIPGENSIELIKGFQEAGAITIDDIDDYWTPPFGHPIRPLALAKKLPERILENLHIADYITTTTKLFSNILKERGLDSKIIPNAIDHNSPQWQNKDKGSDLVKVGWIGGSSHAPDLAKLSGTFNKLFADPELKGKFQVVMCGYDTRGTVTERHPKTGKEVTRKITPEESIWNKFEAIFNNDGRFPENGYVRRNTLPISRYGEHYNYVDICLAPLVENTFNQVKSELKIIETGMMGKALIASDNSMAHELIEHGKNGLLIPSKKDHKLWVKYIKQLILDEAMRKELGNNLHDLVDPDYRLENVTTDRCNWYKELLKK